MEEFKDSDALDAGLLAARAGGRALRDLALRHAEEPGREQLGMQDVARLLDETLAEEKKTDAAADGDRRAVNVNRQRQAA